jgi:hypothetical protein
VPSLVWLMCRCVKSRLQRESASLSMVSHHHLSRPSKNGLSTGGGSFLTAGFTDLAAVLARRSNGTARAASVRRSARMGGLSDVARGGCRPQVRMWEKHTTDTRQSFGKVKLLTYFLAKL